MGAEVTIVGVNDHWYTLWICWG